MTVSITALLHSMLDSALNRIFIPAIPVGVVHVWCQETYSKEMGPRSPYQHFPIAAIKCHRLDSAVAAVALVESFIYASGILDVYTLAHTS